MHLNDALGRHPQLRIIFNHHEQAAAIAAESYARVGGSPAALNVTTGPGGINALNGVFGAYVDSIPMIVISGQVKRETYAPNFDHALRQLGDQEVDIVSMVRRITKYAVVLQVPERTREVVEKAIWLSMRGRPGPVWIDVPGDVQGAIVDSDALAPFDRTAGVDDPEINPNTAGEANHLAGAPLGFETDRVISELRRAERPVILAGDDTRPSLS